MKAKLKASMSFHKIKLCSQSKSKVNKDTIKSKKRREEYCLSSAGQQMYKRKKNPLLGFEVLVKTFRVFHRNRQFTEIK